MRPGITFKLFLAILATCVLVLITMHWGLRASFERGFIDYVRQSNEQRLSQLSESLAEQYAQYGSWRFLHNNERLIYQLLHSIEQNSNDGERGPLPREWRVRFWVTNAQGRKLVGPPQPPPEDAVRQAILVNGVAVGWVLSTPVSRLTRNVDINFDRQQQRISWLMISLSILLAAAVAWLISRGLLAPLKRLVTAIHRLAAGDFSTRVPVSSRDEMGLLAQDFNQLAITLEKNEQIRRALMADVSHELRTPLAILRGELEALQDGVRPLTPASVQSLQAEVLTLGKLVDDLHQLSLSDAGALSYRKTLLDPLQLLQTILALFHERFQKKAIRLHTRLPASASMFGDPDRLTQLFTNLLENCLRYTNAGGELEVGMQQQQDALLFYWQDSAPGISDEQLTLIFSRFYRSEESRNRASGGSGLGLAICQNIVEAHGGRISAEHSPLGGVRITVLLPQPPARSA